MIYSPSSNIDLTDLTPTSIGSNHFLQKRQARLDAFQKEIKNTQLFRCAIDFLSLRSIQWTGGVFFESSFYHSDFSDCHFSGVTFLKTHFQKVHSMNTVFSHCFFENGSWEFMENLQTDRGVHFQGCLFKDVSEKTFSYLIRFGSIFSDCLWEVPETAITELSNSRWTEVGITILKPPSEKIVGNPSTTNTDFKQTTKENTAPQTPALSSSASVSNPKAPSLSRFASLEIKRGSVNEPG